MIGRKWVVTACLLLATLTLAASCGIYDAKPPLTAEEVVSKAVDAMKDLKDYRMDTTMVMDMAVTGAQEMQVRMTSEGTGAFDMANMAYSMAMHMGMRPSQGEFEEADIETYFVDGTNYIKFTPPGEEPVWMKASLPPGHPQGGWDSLPAPDMQQLTVLLQEALSVEMLDDEVVNGAPHYVVKVTPDLKDLWQAMMRAQPPIAGFAPPDMDELEQFLANVVTDFTLKMWIGKDTFSLAQSEISMAMVVSPESMGLGDESGVDFEMNATTTMNMSIYAHNQGVSISLPPEAAQAQEIPIAPRR